MNKFDVAIVGGGIVVLTEQQCEAMDEGELRNRTMVAEQ